jgi:hypothetical protein
MANAQKSGSIIFWRRFRAQSASHSLTLCVADRLTLVPDLPSYCAAVYEVGAKGVVWYNEKRSLLRIIGRPPFAKWLYLAGDNRR